MIVIKTRHYEEEEEKEELKSLLNNCNNEKAKSFCEAFRM